MKTKYNYPAWVTEEQKQIWDKRIGVQLIEVKSLATPKKTFEALICRPGEIAVLEAGEKMSQLTGNNIFASHQILAKFCTLKSPELAAECNLAEGEYGVQHDIAIGRVIKDSYPVSEVTVKKSLEIAS